MDAPRKFTGCCAVEAAEVTNTIQIQILQILVSLYTTGKKYFNATSQYHMFLVVAKEGHNKRDILLATSWKTSWFDRCTHRGGIWMDLDGFGGMRLGGYPDLGTVVLLK